MSEKEIIFDPSAICRLCLEDLTQFAEYYEIDESLGEILHSLTTISAFENENLSICMCPTCFTALTSFNESKKFWLENQKVLESSEDETLHQLEIQEEQEETEEVKENENYMKIVNDENDENYQEVEYVDETVQYSLEQDEILNQHDYSLNQTRKYQRKRNKSGESSQKAKEIYKSLLKKCDECGKMIEKNRLEGHINKHLGRKPFVCEFENCGKTFYCRLLHRLHKTSIHTGQTVECHICQKTFPSERSLYTHSLRHKNADRYKCSHCEKSFNNSNSLKRHLAIHSGVRDWKCDFCTSSFYRKFNLDVHVRTVHKKEKHFSCHICSKNFGYSRLLRGHMKKIHSDLDEETENVES